MEFLNSLKKALKTLNFYQVFTKSFDNFVGTSQNHNTVWSHVQQTHKNSDDENVRISESLSRHNTNATAVNFLFRVIVTQTKQIDLTYDFTLQSELNLTFL